MTITLFPKHYMWRCDRDAVSRENCIEGRCMFCEGGISWCKTCGGGEGDLPTHCPQFKMDSLTSGKVYAGGLDFVRGKWVCL